MIVSLFERKVTNVSNDGLIYVDLLWGMQS